MSLSVAANPSVNVAPSTADDIDTSSQYNGAKFHHFFDLPRELRDMIYLHWPKMAWIDVMQTFPGINTTSTTAITTGGIPATSPKSVAQPNISKVCRRTRRECLEVFYGKNKFLIDLRGWKHADYPREWTPGIIFERWIDGIGDINAARLRILSFWSHNFAVHIRVECEPRLRLTMKFRPLLLSPPEVVEGLPAGYDYDVACAHAAAGLRAVLDEIETACADRGLGVEDVKKIGSMIEFLQPFLCKRSHLGYRGAVLPSEHVSQWPSPQAHLNACDDCGYHRFTRGDTKVGFL